MSVSPSDVKWDERGLAPAVAVDAATGAVRMLAWMNAEALERTCATGLAHFWSRSRGALWRKGEESGHTLAVRELRLDCDRDAILLVVDPAGPTCHTGAASCFYRRAEAHGWAEDDGPRGAPAAVLDRLERVIAERAGAGEASTSYTAKLLRAGPAEVADKIVEEAGELADEVRAAGADGAADRAVHEAADLLYHALVGLRAAGATSDRVWAELARRFGIGGLVEKASRGR